MGDSYGARDARAVRLLSAASDALNADAGATMGQIAAAAGVGRATLHRHFATRDDLIVAVGDFALDRWEGSLHASGALELDADAPADAHRAVLGDLVRRFVADAGEFAYAMANPDLERHPQLVERVAALIALDVRVLAAAQAAGVLRDDVPPEWVDHVLFGLLRAGIDAQRYGDVAPRAIPDLVASTFFAAVGR